MASLHYNHGLPLIGYADAAGKRHWLRPGRCDRRTAERVRGHVEALATAARLGTPVPDDTATWAAGLPAGGHVRRALVRHGLLKGETAPPVAPKPAADAHALGAVFTVYIGRRSDLKLRSRMNLCQAKREAVKFFGATRDVRTLTRAEGHDYLRALKAAKAGSTAAAYFKRLKQVLADAADRKLIPVNPLAGIKAGRERNAERRRYVPAADVLAAIGQCPDAKWRLLFALARFGGLRVPSETHGLKWEDVRWAESKIVVHSPKTERHEGRGRRIVPLFPELLLYLRDALEAAQPGEVCCLQGLTLWPHLTAKRIVARAGLTPWPKPFQNLRASRQTDLAARFPLHVVCAWLGNSEDVAKNHYLIVTEADYARASLDPSAPEGASRQDVVSPTVSEPAESGPAATASNTMNQYPFGESGSSPLDALTPEQQQKTHLALQEALHRRGRAFLARLNEALPHIRQTDIDRLTAELRAAKAERGRSREA